MAMDWRFELVPVPVTDIDRAKRFYGEQVGFTVDYDTPVSDTMRIVQLTPPGSACSILLGGGSQTPPGSLDGLLIVVTDVAAALLSDALDDDGDVAFDDDVED